MMNFENQTTQSKRKQKTYTPHPITQQLWHPSKNLDRKPEHYTTMSRAKAWFCCEQAHEWYGLIATTINRGCPECHAIDKQQNSLQDQILLAEACPCIARLPLIAHPKHRPSLACLLGTTLLGVAIHLQLLGGLVNRVNIGWYKVRSICI